MAGPALAARRSMASCADCAARSTVLRVRSATASAVSATEVLVSMHSLLRFRRRECPPSLRRAAAAAERWSVRAMPVSADPAPAEQVHDAEQHDGPEQRYDECADTE